jgi:cytochrome c oxidase assembly factor CtaG
VRGQLFGTLRCLSFVTGIATLFLVLISPLDGLDDQLFSAHMAQHMVLMMVAPPLLVFGRPTLAWLWAFPLAARRVIGRIWVGTGLRRTLHRIGTPAVIWILCSVALWFWHLPGPFAWSLASEPVHALEHSCFFGTPLLFWSLVLEPLAQRRIDYGMTIIFVVTFGLQMGLLGALLTFAGHPLYTAYLQTSEQWGLSPLEDQQLGGLSMWIPGSLIHLTTLGVLVAAWMREDESLSIADAAVRRKAAVGG